MNRLTAAEVRQRADAKARSWSLPAIGDSTLVMILWGLAVFALMLVLAIVRVNSIKLGYTISGEMVQVKSITRENIGLRVMATTLKTPYRIKHFARTELGLGDPLPSQVIIIK